MAKAPDKHQDAPEGVAEGIDAPEAKTAAGGAAVPPKSVAPRKRGRPPGQPKTGGKVKGTKNWSNPELRDLLLERSQAVATLASIAAGESMLVSGPTGKEYWARPTMDQRIRAVEAVMKKVLPDLQSTALTGADDTPLFTGDPPDRRSTARAILIALSGGINASAALTATADAPFPIADGSVGTLPEPVVLEAGADTSGETAPVSSMRQYPSAEDAVEPGLPEADEPEAVGNCSIMLSGTGRWFVHGRDGLRVCGAANREAALRLAAELDETGKITR